MSTFDPIILCAVSLIFGVGIGAAWVKITQRERMTNRAPAKPHGKSSNRKTSPVVKPEAIPEFRPPAKGNEHMVYPAKGNVKTGPGKPLPRSTQKLQQRIWIYDETCQEFGIADMARARIEEIELEEANK